MTLGLVVSASPDEAELAADMLWGFGAVAVEERAAGEHVELWTSLGEDEAGIRAVLPDRWPYRFVVLDDAAADTWREFAQPIRISPTLVIAPEWNPVDAGPGEIVLLVDAGATFGMGDHPTTVLCLQALECLLKPGDRVLDVGCGSGVLAIAALKLGASEAVAIDINPASVEVSLHNATLNGITSGLSVSNDPMSAVSGTFDLVLANILAPVLIELADEIIASLRPGAYLVLSGLLGTNLDHVKAAYASLDFVGRSDLDPWASLTFVNPGG